MGISAGIIGLPNVGKSTIFNALTGGSVAAENYPFCTIDPNIGIVAVPDERITRITALLPTEKVVPAFLELVDIAGLVKGASLGEGLGNQFLGHIKNVNAIVHIVRCFEDDDVVHVNGSIDPLRDVSIVNTELMLKDLETVEKALERAVKAAKSGDKELKAKVALFQRAQEALARGQTIRQTFTDKSDCDGLRELQLLTAKNVLYVANIDEADLQKENDHIRSLRSMAAAEGSDCMALCGKVEAEIAQLSVDDRKEFLRELGIAQPGLDLLAQRIYVLLGLITFFTATPKETRAWPVRAGTHAATAAGIIHTDFERGFIKAETYTLNELESYKSETALKAAGKIRQEGRDYIVQDGDIIFFRFNV